MSDSLEAKDRRLVKQFEVGGGAAILLLLAVLCFSQIIILPESAKGAELRRSGRSNPVPTDTPPREDAEPVPQLSQNCMLLKEGTTVEVVEGIIAMDYKPHTTTQLNIGGTGTDGGASGKAITLGELTGDMLGGGVVVCVEPGGLGDLRLPDLGEWTTFKFGEEARTTLAAARGSGIDATVNNQGVFRDPMSACHQSAAVDARMRVAHNMLG